LKPTFAILAAVAAAALMGCGHLDTTPEGDPSRVLMGTVDVGGASLPPGTVVTVRVVVPQRGDAPLRVLGSQTIRDPGASPVSFRVEYVAEDDLLRHGLNIEARVSWGGRVRYYNMNGYAVTLGNAADPHRIVVNAVGQ
jgi:uncharacterized lipoprotein YbaY